MASVLTATSPMGTTAEHTGLQPSAVTDTDPTVGGGLGALAGEAEN